MSASKRFLRAAIAACLAIGAYLGAAAFTFHADLVPVRPLYEGLAPPPPYRWVKPPADLAKSNQPPAGASDSIDLLKTGSKAGTVSTPDVQATVILPDGAYPPKAGEKKVKITITPKDPATVGDPPKGMAYDGNAYEVTATYETSGEPATPVATDCPPATSGKPTKCLTVVLRYPISATGLYRRDGNTWVKVQAQSASLQLYGDTFKTGTFVAAGAGKPGTGKGDIIAIAAGVLAVGLGVVFGRMRGRRVRARRKAQAQARKQRQAKKKGSAPPKKKR